jgi:hypothetical protein
MGDIRGQCFYTETDIHELMRKNRLPGYRLERIAFSTPEEIKHIRQVYGDSIRGIPDALFADYPYIRALAYRRTLTQSCTH